MLRRDRVRAALERHEPDWVPMDLWITQDAYVALRRELGLSPRVSRPWEWQATPDAIRPGSTTWTTDARVDLDVVEKLDLDIVRIPAYPPNDGRGFVLHPEDGLFYDEWHVPHVRKEITSGYGGAMFEIARAPLADATIDDLDSFPWPTAKDPSFLGDLPEIIPRVRRETPYAILSQFGRGGIFEQAKYLRGFEQILVDVALNPEFVHALFARLVDVELEMNRIGIEAVGRYIDILRLSPEDLGTQTSTLVSPRTFEALIRPYYARRFHAVREMLDAVGNAECKIMYHSCGAVYRFMRPLIDDGMQVFDPLQPLETVSEPWRLKRDFGREISFLGGISVQSTLPRGTVDEVRAAVRQLIGVMAPGGGYILSSSHRILPDIPVRNVTAMYQAGREFGAYPVTDRVRP